MPDLDSVTKQQEILSERLRLKISPSLSSEIDSFGINYSLNRSEVVRAALAYFFSTTRHLTRETILELAS